VNWKMSKQDQIVISQLGKEDQIVTTLPDMSLPVIREARPEML